MAAEIRTDWYEVSLGSVMSYYADGLTVTDREIFKLEWFVDAGKGKVVFKIVTRHKDAQ